MNVARSFFGREATFTFYSEDLDFLLQLGDAFRQELDLAGSVSPPTVFPEAKLARAGQMLRWLRAVCTIMHSQLRLQSRLRLTYNARFRNQLSLNHSLPY